MESPDAVQLARSRVAETAQDVLKVGVESRNRFGPELAAVIAGDDLAPVFR